jgi:3-deoxy-D-manno-octulosonic-acid transferase
VWVVNGRISDASYRGYRKVRYYFRKVSDFVLQYFVQTSEDAERLRKLGVEHVQVLGSAKFDLPVPSDVEQAHAISIIEAAGLSPEGMFWVMGSTWPGEEGPLMDIFMRLRQQHPALQAILVPRHAERGDEVEDIIRGRSLSYIRRSKMACMDAEMNQAPSVLLADSTGELAGFYMLADMVFVGKSLAGNRGGQNPAEPASMGKPVITGPAMDNFSSVMRDLRGASAILVAHDFRELEDMSGMLLSDRTYREEMGARAAAFVRSHRGVMQKSAHMIFSELEKRKR